MKKVTENDDLRIISGSIKKLLQLDEQERKIHRAQKAEIETINTIMKRYCDDRKIKEKMAKNDQATKILREAKELISKLRVILKSSPQN